MFIDFIFYISKKIYIYIYICGDKGPNLYTRSWTLFDDVDKSEEK